MTTWLLIPMCTSLFFTILVEVCAGAILGIRSKTGILAIVLVNVVTNPILVFSMLISRIYVSTFHQWLFLILELAACVIEIFLYKKLPTVIRSPVRLSVIANFLSLSLGILCL